MTPFDPVALVAMLVAFYLPATSANLARARLERPEYFAAGTLGGSHGDKLTLPDGSCWDCLFASGTNDPAQMHYQCIPCGDGAPGDARYPLEPGPLVPVDLTLWPEPTPMPVFVPLVAAGLDELAGVDDTLHLAGQTVTEQSSPAGLEAAYQFNVPPAAARAGEIAVLAAQATPADVYATTISHGGPIDTNAAVFDEAPPADLPPVSDLPPAPPPDTQPPPDHQ